MKKTKTKSKAELLLGFAKSRKVIALGSVAVVVVVAFALSPWGIAGTHAYAGNEWCAKDTYGKLACLNAWNGGPWVKIYTGKGVANNYFNLIQDSTGYSYFKFTGPGGWYGHCIGDAYNDPYTENLSSLDPCGSGWGTYFYAYQACDNYTGWQFKNRHSGKFLSFQGATGSTFNGASVYLDSGTRTCWHHYQ